MRKTVTIIILLTSLLANSKTKLNTITDKQDKGQKMCFELIEKIINSSSYNLNFYKKYKATFVIIINEATKKKITIKILLKSKTDTNIPLGWLELDLIKNQLKDITDDPDHPILIKFDMTLLKQFEKNCLQYCLD